MVVAGGAGVATAGAGATVIDSGWLMLCVGGPGSESVASKVNVPVLLGVPEPARRRAARASRR